MHKHPNLCTHENTRSQTQPTHTQAHTQSTFNGGLYVSLSERKRVEVRKRAMMFWIMYYIMKKISIYLILVNAHTLH